MRVIVGLMTAVLLLAAVTVALAAWPTIQSYPQVSNTTIVANNSTAYTINVTIADNDGYNDIGDVRVLFDYTESGGDQTKGRGYIGWAQTDALLTRYGGTWTLANAGGSGGRWGYATDIWGGVTYITPLACNMSVSGSASGGAGSRTIIWQFRAKPAWAVNPLINDADVWAADLSNNVIGWRDNSSEFDVVTASCTSTAATPHAPVLSNPTDRTVQISIDPADSDTDLYCIRASNGTPTEQFVQADGTLGGPCVSRTRAQWGNMTLTGLSSGTTYWFKVRAVGAMTGSCPSSWSLASSATTAIAIHTIDYTPTGTAINKGIAGNNSLPWSQSAQREADVLANCYNTSVRFGATDTTGRPAPRSGTAVPRRLCRHSAKPATATPICRSLPTLAASARVTVPRGPTPTRPPSPSRA